MKRPALAIAIVVLAASFLAAQDIAKADRIPIPEWGILRFQESGLEYLGYSAGEGGMLFRRYGSTEGIGGNPDIDYVIVDPSDGATRREIPVNKNLFVVGDPSDEEAWADLLEQNDEMAAKAEEEIARISDLDDRSFSDGLFGTGGIVRCVNEEETYFGPYEGAFRYYVYYEPTGWLKPMHESREYATSAAAISFTGTHLTAGGTMLMLEFYRAPIMEFDTGSQIYFIFSPEQTAQYFNEVGFSWYGKGDYDEALAGFRLALSAFPDFSKAAYNAACMSALRGNVEEAIRYLRELERIRAERVDDYAVTAEKSLLAVDKDTDFNAIRADPAFAKELKRIRAR